MRLPRCLARCLRLCLAALLWLAAAAQAAPAPPLQLSDDTTAAVDAWPALGLLGDADGRLDAEAALRRLADFQRPDGPQANLGPRRDVVWLQLPVEVAGGDGRWVLNIDYPPLNRIELTVLRDGRPLARYLLGNAIDADQRPMRSRGHAVELQLAPGVPHLLLMRVQTQSAMVLPITLAKPAVHHAREARADLVQGVLAGIALALLAYSLAHWISLRDPMFLEYAVMLGALLVFFVSYFGIGQQHLWTGSGEIIGKLPPLGVLMALAAGTLFGTSALQTRRVAPRTHRALVALSALAGLCVLASLAGALNYRATQVMATLIGPMPLLLGIPVAWRLARAGDRLALMMMLGWLSYVLGVLSLAGLLRGLLPANFWSQHGIQYASLLEMLIWTRVLGMRIAGIRTQAERVELERAALLSLAHTDALTGLPNRRGLQAALGAALAECQGDQALALYLLDLDGFKPVNDRLGHDAGDTLLVQVGQRLRQQLRQGDLVARLGGDEFVIMAPAIPGEAEALALGRKLLAAFDEPFVVGGQACRVGLTIGFTLAPHDGQHAEDLLKRADAAMYVGKQSGRHTVRRGGASAGLTFSS